MTLQELGHRKSQIRRERFVNNLNGQDTVKPYVPESGPWNRANIDKMSLIQGQEN